MPPALIPRPQTRTSLARLASGWAAGGLGAAFILLGGWWFTLAVGVIEHLGLLEFFRMARFKGIRPAVRTSLVAVQLLLASTMAASGGNWPGSEGVGDVAAAVLPASGAVICGWLLLQPQTGTIAEIKRLPKGHAYHLKIDTGMDIRTVVSGISEYFEPEKIVGKQVCLLANLEPREIKGIKSQGMILLAEESSGRLIFVTPEEPATPGSVVK